MGKVLEVVQWVLLVLVIAYLIAGTWFVVMRVNNLRDSFYDKYELERSEMKARSCEVKDGCAYGRYEYDKSFGGSYFAGCLNKDKITSLKEIPEGMTCSCISGQCVSVS